MEQFPIEFSHVLMFARAIGDPNPIYTDPGHGAASEFGATLAPPTFVQGAAQFTDDYPLRPSPGTAWFGSGSKPTGVVPVAPPADSGGSGSMMSGLHAEQHFEYHRPLLVGDVLTSTTRPGNSWEKQGRSGVLKFSESVTEFRDAAGNLVVTARAVGVVTQGPVAGDR